MPFCVPLQPPAGLNWQGHADWDSIPIGIASARAGTDRKTNVLDPQEDTT